MSVADKERTLQRTSVTLALSTILLGVLVATLGWRTGPAAAQKVSTPSLERSRTIPKLVPAPGQLRDQCVLAATRLGFPVPWAPRPHSPRVSGWMERLSIPFSSLSSTGSMCPRATQESMANQLVI